MSVAALVALAHDVVITIGVYALSGFEVTPATVTGVLTILGFSLYDTVVVFDKVRENTKAMRADPDDLRRGGQPRRQPDPGALDQHLDRGAASRSARSSTSARSSSGSGNLKDLALALFVGMAAGAYSSIFIATPLAGAHEVGRDGREAGRAAREGPSARGGRPVRRGPGPGHRQARWAAGPTRSPTSRRGPAPRAESARGQARLRPARVGPRRPPTDR